ncbi:NAD(P)-dependent oxidoreductase [Comamonas aquatica]|uniref:NAD(P)-binding domain-containing protein n=1 Tax=Comamonas aquatica TaxID=225991 RepID=A0AA42HVC9_9BURK|nr:NAD(P)-binding domain-containing protein [Comamonas aquatica]MDH0365232.1 NAD(P)-binding domain-containing protein [Comamonas aquatica]
MKFAVLGGGMVGSCYTQALLQQGHVLVGLCDLQPSNQISTTVQEAGAQIHNAPGAWLSDADVVLSAVFGTVAHEIFRASLGHLKRGTLYVDMTTADPLEMKACAALARETQVDFVDVAITGAVNLGGAKTPLLLAGEQAQAVQELYAPFGGSVRVVGSNPGEAASLKLLRSIFTKGMEALAVECLGTAEAMGLREQLYVVLEDIDQTPLRSLMESMVQTHIPHSGRRRNEVIEAQHQIKAQGLLPIVSQGVEAMFAATAQAQATHPYSGTSITDALHWLNNRVLASK